MNKAILLFKYKAIARFYEQFKYQVRIIDIIIGINIILAKSQVIAK